MELIDRAALGIGPAKPELFDKPGYADGWNSAVSIINKAPTIDAVPVVHGRWINNRRGFWELCDCSICGAIQPTTGRVPKYCPNCGAMMDGGMRSND